MTNREIQDVIRISDSFFHAMTLPDAHDAYKLVEVRNLVFSGSDYRGAQHWKTTYLLKREIDRVKGGEIYIHVDILEQKAELLGFGE